MPQQPAPPVQIPVMEQYQEQDQSQSAIAGDNILNDYSNNSTESRSNSSGTSNFSGSLSNIAIQNNNTGYFQYEREVRIPTTSLNLTSYTETNSSGIALTLSIPLGGRQKRLAYRQIEKRIEEVEINNAARQLSACANVNAAGFSVSDWNTVGLPLCNNLIVAKADPVSAVDEYKKLIQEQREAMQKQNVLIQKLLIQIDNMQTETNNPFRSNG